MAINSNNPIRQVAESINDINKVTKTALEAVADKIHDADGDQTSFKDVKKAFNELSPTEKVAFTTSATLTAGALPVVSLLAEEAADATTKLAKTTGKVLRSMGQAVTEKYKQSPEEKLIKQTEKAIDQLKDAVQKRYSQPPEQPLINELNRVYKKLID